MEKLNILFLLTPKTQLAYLTEKMNARQALEKMRARGYTAIPLISNEGEYLGIISEGDLLWCIVDNNFDKEELENIPIASLVRDNFRKSVKVDAGIKVVTDMITEQNFVPVVDDRNILMGIVTRKSVLQLLLKDEM